VSTDADGTTPTLSATASPPLPPTAVFVDSANGRGGFVFNPVEADTGQIYSVRFIASDGVLADTELVVIKVIGCRFGDANSSGVINVADIIYIVQFIFNGGPAPNPLCNADADCSGIVNINDVVKTVQYIFSGGPAPGDIDNDGTADCQ